MSCLRGRLLPAADEDGAEQAGPLEVVHARVGIAVDEIRHRHEDQDRRHARGRLGDADLKIEFEIQAQAASELKLIDLVLLFNILIVSVKCKKNAKLYL